MQSKGVLKYKQAIDELNECPCEYHAKRAEAIWSGLSHVGMERCKTCDTPIETAKTLSGKKIALTPFRGGQWGRDRTGSFARGKMGSGTHIEHTKELCRRGDELDFGGEDE